MSNPFETHSRLAVNERQYTFRRNLARKSQNARSTGLKQGEAQLQLVSRHRLAREHISHHDEEIEDLARDRQSRTDLCWDTNENESGLSVFTPWVLLNSTPGDPFSTLPSNLPQSFLGQQIQQCTWVYFYRRLITDGLAAGICLTEMVANCSPLDQYGPLFAHHILSMATQNEALLYSMMSAAMMFDRTAKTAGKESTAEIQINSKAVQLLSKQMADPKLATRESNIWAVLALGYSGSVGTVRTGDLPQQSFLKELQSLHIYGRLKINKAHLRGLIRLVSIIGGPQNLKTPGMAGVMSLFVSPIK